VRIKLEIYIMYPAQPVHTFLELLAIAADKLGHIYVH